MKELPSIPAEMEQGSMDMENEDFISLTFHPESSTSDILLDMVIGILSKQVTKQKHIKRIFHQPIPLLSQYNVSDAIQFVKRSLEMNQCDTRSWIVYLKLFLALGIDLRCSSFFHQF